MILSLQDMSHGVHEHNTVKVDMFSGQVVNNDFIHRALAICVQRHNIDLVSLAVARHLGQRLSLSLSPSVIRNRMKGEG